MVDNTLPIVGSQDRFPASPVFQMRLLTVVPSPYDFDIGGTLNPSSLTHSYTHSVYTEIHFTWKNERK